MLTLTDEMKYVTKFKLWYVYVIGPGQRIGQSESPLPYLSPAMSGSKLLNGANFASAGVGILNDTGVQFVSTFNFFKFNYIYMHACLLPYLIYIYIC